MTLRKHQSEFKEVIDLIKSGSKIKHIYLHATPGAGKSAIPVIAGDLIRAGLADKLAWIVPRLTLAYQAETNFINPFFRDLLGHNLCIRSATNDQDPSRGQDGFVTTYQALGVDDKKTVLKDFLRHRYILILDEFHHCELNGVWHKEIDPMVNDASFVIFMTGTLSRGDDKPIAWTPYHRQGKILIPNLTDGVNRAIIKYTRSDALQERAVLPLNFTLYDGDIEYEKADGKKVSGSISGRYEETGAAIYTALNTEFADQLLKEGLDHWISHKTQNRRSKIIIVTANIAHAKEVLKKVQGLGLPARIAVSEDSLAAHRALKDFKANSLDALVGVGMFYEGFDCKPLTHVIALTHIRSMPWIEQMVSRAVRIDPQAGPYESQRGYIFAPDDPLMRRVVDQIKKEQLPLVKDQEGSREKKSGDGNGESTPDIIPINGRLTGKREISFSSFFPAAASEDQPVATISDREMMIRKAIDKHVKEFAFRNYYKVQKINFEIKEYAGKPREQMTLKELELCLEYIRYNYPLNGKAPADVKGSKPRGKGKRVPAKAQSWQGRLF